MLRIDVTAGGSRYIKLSDNNCRLYITGYPESGEKVNRSDINVTFESLTPEVADVSCDGFVTPKKEGDAVFRVTAEYDNDVVSTEARLPVFVGKTMPTLMTMEKRLIARENIRRYDWAKKEADAVIESADYYLKFEDKLWDLVPGEGIARCLTVGKEGDPFGYYCRYCGTDLRALYGNYPWIINALEDPWKVKCPHCQRRFPSNNFGEYYKLGINEYGVFDPVLAKEKNDLLIRSGKPGYLVNELYPEMGEGWGVDDGFGYIPKDEKGNPHIYENGVMEKHTYIGYYMHWGLWCKSQKGGSAIVEAMHALALAYAYTGDPKYGRAGGILLDRVADLYPDYHYLLGDECHGRGWKGKTIDSIWETGVVRTLAEAYDCLFPVFDDPYVVNYLYEKSKTVKMSHAKTNGTQIRNNIEDGILRASFEGAVNGEVLGNFGYHQLAVATIAVVLDTMPESKQWIEWLMADGDRNVPITGGNIERTLIDIVDRDGMGDEASGYNVGWIRSMMSVADVLDGYDKVKEADLYGHPKFKKMFTALIPVIAGGYYSPQIGDSGSTAGTFIWMSKEIALKGFQKYKDDVFARIAFLENGNKTEGLRLGITEKDPLDIRQKVQEVIDQKGPLELESDMMTGFGFAILRSNPADKSLGKQDFWMYFGRNTGHGHRDTLNLGISAFDLNMAPDLGYPEMTGVQPNRLQWVQQTLSHNTVLVDGETQNQPFPNGKGGYPLHFDDSGIVKVMDVDAPKQFEKTESYRRSLVMVEAEDKICYGVDFFRILGGQSHLYSFHSQSDEIDETEGLCLIPQQDENGNYVGSYAGPDVPYGPDPHSPQSWRYKTVYPRGYTWTHTVRRDQNKPSSFSVDFKVKDFNKVLSDPSGLHLRMTVLSDEPFDEVAIVKGHTPKKYQNINVPDLDYVFVKRTGSDLDTLFTVVFEPYRHRRILKSVEAADAVLIDGNIDPKDKVKAVKLTTAKGRTDYIVYSTNPGATYRVDNLFDFRGFIGVYAERDGKVLFKYVNDGDIIDGKIADKGAVTGKVTDFTKTLSDSNKIFIRPDSPNVDPMDLAGRFIYIDNDKEENGAYKIRSAKSNPDGSIELDIGGVTLIRSFKGKSREEYVYNIRVNDTFRIPLAKLIKG
jgi:hypothetical protein